MDMKRIRTTAGVIALMCILAGCSSPAANTASETTAPAETTAATTQETTAEHTEAETVSETEAASEGESAEAGASSGENSEAKKYLDDLANSFRPYSDAAHRHADAWEKKDYEAERTAIADMEAALGGFRTMSVPEKYKERHEKLLGTVDKEFELMSYYRKITDLQERMAGYDENNEPSKEEEEELEALFAEVQEIENKVDTGFPAEFIELVKAVKEDIG